MQIEQFAAITRNVIQDQGFDEFQPTVCFPDRRDIRSLSGVPADEAQEQIALGWAAELAKPGEEFLVAFKHSATEFNVVQCLNGAQQHQIYAAEI